MLTLELSDVDYNNNDVIDNTMLYMHIIIIEQRAVITRRTNEN